MVLHTYGMLSVVVVFYKACTPNGVLTTHHSPFSPLPRNLHLIGKMRAVITEILNDIGFAGGF